jgi:hypothetical protein
MGALCGFREAFCLFGGISLAYRETRFLRAPCRIACGNWANPTAVTTFPLIQEVKNAAFPPTSLRRFSHSVQRIFRMLKVAIDSTENRAKMPPRREENLLLFA